MTLAISEARPCAKPADQWLLDDAIISTLASAHATEWLGACAGINHSRRFEHNYIAARYAACAFEVISGERTDHLSGAYRRWPGNAHIQ